MPVLPALLLTALVTTAASAQTLTAVLDDGTRLNVVGETKIGSFLVRTEFGLLRSQGERISLLVDGSEEVRLLEPLRALDYSLWALRLSERGHLLRLATEVPILKNRSSLFEAVRVWGQRLDNLPLSTKREDRVRLLWEWAQQADNADLALIVGALEVEISPTLGQHERRISLVKWREALSSNRATQRWAAARVAAVQRDQNAELDLLEVSLDDIDLWVSLEAGRALHLIDPAGAIYRWAYEMVMSRDKHLKQRCALQLAKWGRTDPETAQRVADRMRAYSRLRRQACQPGSNIPVSGGDITNNSILEVVSPSTLAMDFLADTIERVAKSAEQPVPAAEELQGEVSEADLQKAQAEAWRKLFMGR